jgi:hypothetical protein
MMVYVIQTIGSIIFYIHRESVVVLLYMLLKS